MSKHLIPFNNSNNWKSNANCPICESIDKLYNEAFLLSGEDREKILRFLDDSYVINGYNLVPVYEKNGYHISRKNDIERIKKYPTNSEVFMYKVNTIINPMTILDAVEGDPDFPTLIHSRWCRYCGSRKPSIYDTDREKESGEE